jgi:hypothetical protein
MFIRMREGVCENEQDAPLLVGQMNRGVKVSAAILAKYAGTYELRDTVPGMPPGFPPPFTISLADGQLYVGALPLITQSETIFQEFDGMLLEFYLNASGAVTGLTRMFSESESGFFHKH